MANCLTCGKKSIGAYCFQHKPRKRLTAHKPMNKIGKVQKETAKAVAKWKRAQQPSHEGYYTCYICGRAVDYLMAEHVKSKVRRPDLRTDPNNFKPTCAPCNEEKGSRSN